jgi:hypothetical protein
MKLALNGKELSVDFKDADGWLGGSLEDAYRYLVNQMEGTAPAQLVHPEDPTDTANLYNELTEYAQVLFGNETRSPIRN